MIQTAHPLFVEKDFYLEEFRGKSFFFTLQAGTLKSQAEVETLASVCRDLATNETRVVFLIETADATPDSTREQRLIERLSLRIAETVQLSHILQPQPIILPTGGEDNPLLEQLWAVLRTTPVCIGLWPTHMGRPDRADCLEHSQPTLLSCAQRLAVRLKAHKLVILDALGGLTAGERKLSFMNGAVLTELLRQGEAEWTGLEIRRPLLNVIRAALEGGVASVSVCTPSDLARELFTYAGCGTLFTLTDYCRVEPLGLDDFYDAERLIQRGEQEGYLKSRTSQETSRLLLHGYGAWLGVTAGELAGFCALLPYPDDKAGEIVALYTITRFQGEGIGGGLVSRMIQEAKTAGLCYIFACTFQDGAQRLFERYGFHQVGPGAVPHTKWQDYDLARKEQIAIYRQDL